MVRHVVIALFFFGDLAARAAVSSQATPVNQVFQFSESGTCSALLDGSTSTATAYLWLPETWQRLRGLVVMGVNVPEDRLVGDQEILRVCAAHDLGIVWCVPTFVNFKFKAEQATTLAFFQQLLDGLAKTSGCSEVATASWLPMGERPCRSASPSSPGNGDCCPCHRSKWPSWSNEL